MDLSPARPLENADFSVSAVLSFNSSEGPREVGAALLVDGTARRNLTVEAAPGGRAFANFTLSLPAGEHTLAVVADPSDLLFETDEGNNRASLRAAVEPLPPILPEVGILPGGTNVVVRGNVVRRCSRQGIWFMGNTMSMIVGNTVDDIAGTHANGISVYMDSADILIAGNVVTRSPSPFTFEASSNITVVNNVFDAEPGLIYHGFNNATDPYNYDSMGRFFHVRLAQSY